MKPDNDLTMRDLKHRGVKPPHFLETDNGTLIMGLIIGLIGSGLMLLHGI